MTTTDYTVSTAVDIGVALASTSTLCNYVTAKLSGSDSDWADATAIAADCTSCSDLDGYQVEVVTSVYAVIMSDAAVRSIGGCMATATTASAVCIWTSITDYTDKWDITGYTVGWATTEVFAAGVSATTATAVITTTAITVASNYLAVPSVCTAAVGAATVSTCSLAGTTITATAATATTVGSTSTFSWYQPDEDSDGYTTTMPRFSAEDLVGWWGLDATAAGSTYLLAQCGTAGTLSGASAVVAGAAVAFGAAALAF